MILFTSVYILFLLIFLLLLTYRHDGSTRQLETTSSSGTQSGWTKLKTNQHVLVHENSIFGYVPDTSIYSTDSFRWATKPNTCSILSLLNSQPFIYVMHALHNEGEWTKMAQILMILFFISTYTESYSVYLKVKTHLWIVYILIHVHFDLQTNLKVHLIWKLALHHELFYVPKVAT